jgi:hypothetical protein
MIFERTAVNLAPIEKGSVVSVKAIAVVFAVRLPGDFE